ncbi:EAL domain-containing protein [Agrobacterium vitis]|uniref:EAL domain-containing protein n=1 Tax=Agrobacterium vitis TaxID=373 RepID=A0ABD6GCE3_AGRVI|nr:EAL domain-containing protein [Agrobacterium vitis]MUO93788.1 EAL domain-containing protein [Agrobacterium vitis]MUP03961.1 EAL domain-containing protein [Agrobacterium vitis]MVA91954.1 EAL domain-containing protein [Agrobacterium vitis]MVB01477.1 EAL domain-containing protein [Agrobacterium vitis]
MLPVVGSRDEGRNLGYPIPSNEDERIQLLESYVLIDTPPEREFDHIVQMTSRIFNVPTVLVSLVHRDRQFFKARVGLDACETGRDVSFCTFAIMGTDVFVVPDAHDDPRFRENALVTGHPNIRFYAGAPLITPSGHALGSLCLIDTKPRHDFSSRDRLVLQDLAAMVLERIELRRLELSDRESRSRFRNIASTSPDGIVCANASNQITSWNSAAEAMFGYTADEAVGKSLDIIVPGTMRARHGSGLARVAMGGPTRIIGTSLKLTACRRDGSEFPIELSLSQWTETGEKYFGAIIRDITQRAEAEKLLKQAAEFDHLTGLANRPSLHRHMQHACNGGSGATVVLIDLDGFKDVNDTLGHLAGDFVLQVVAERLKRVVPDDQMVARLGGDEFLVFLTGTAEPLSATNLSLSLIALIEEPIEFDDHLIHIGASIGIAVTTKDDCLQAEELLGNADLALYQAKADGRHLVRVFTPELRQTASKKGAISSSIRQAWERQEFELYYQPQVNLVDGSLSGAEALIRWNHPDLGVVSPAAFLPVLETGLLAVPIGEWILHTACRQASEWRAAGLDNFRIGVNLFAAQFRTRDFAQMIEAMLAEFGLPSSALELEITENIILQNEQRIMQPLRHLRALGVGIAFDDFGTGFASLSLLKDYPVSRLKIDRSFVSGADRSEKDKVIIEAVVKLADGFDLNVIAEGIETPEQEDLMRRYRCDEGQGYLYGRPMTASAFADRYVSNESYGSNARIMLGGR